MNFPGHRKRVASIGLMVAITNLLGNTIYWQFVRPRSAHYPEGFPTLWWLALFAAPVIVALSSGWLSRTAEEFSMGILGIVLGLSLEAVVITALHLPGAGRAPVIPPGDNLGAGVMIGTVLWTILMAVAAGLRRMLGGAHRHPVRGAPTASR